MKNNSNNKKIIQKILRLEKLIDTKRRNNKIAFYNSGEKIHKKQLAFHKCTKRNRWVFGGNRSGKTECGAVEVIYMARGIHPYRKNRAKADGWVVSLSREVQRDVAQRKILQYLNPEWIRDIVMISGKSGYPENGIIDFITVENISGEVSTISFKTCEAGREKFQGASLDFVWFDEEPPKEIYDECRMRTVDKKGDVFGTMTPLLGLTFVYNEIYLNDGGDGEIWHIFMEWKDNPYLDLSEIESLSASMSEDELNVRRYGKFISAKGLVYPEFDESIHVIEPFTIPKDWYDNISIDPGLNNPLSCHFYACDYDGNVYVIAEHYEKGKPVHYHAEKIKEIAGILGWHFDAKGRINAIIDSAATQRTLASDKSVAELFYDEGILVNTKVNKDMFSGISRVKRYLSPPPDCPRIYIFSSCVNLIKEIKSYWWGAGDVPKKKDDHALDELRYYLMSKPEAHKSRTDKSEIMLDKERLFRKLTAKKR